jgi:anhydro-N-acetylmuramic acid kinase
MDKLRVIGLMSGTSLDGCDAALVEIAPKNYDVGNKVTISTIDFICYPMPDDLRLKINKQLKPETSRIDELAVLDSLLSRWFVEAVFALLEKAKMSPSDVDVIGCHGQTMWHSVNNEDFTHNMTWQLGDGSYIANLTGITTVCDFRTADVALGGQGAPLIPSFDNLMYGGHSINIALQNIGGIGNVTLIPRHGCGKQTSMGFDTGPGNMIIDRFVDKITGGKELFDKDGRLAA